jgi:predicted acyl esterase
LYLFPKDLSKVSYYNARTPYDCAPYGADQFKEVSHKRNDDEGYIVVYQDVRGRYMSGLYDNMRGFIPNRKIKDIDEASDTYDTIDWLVKNVANNGNVGTGISYPGFYATYSLLKVIRVESSFASGLYFRFLF